MAVQVAGRAAVQVAMYMDSALAVQKDTNGGDIGENISRLKQIDALWIVCRSICHVMSLLMYPLVVQ